ncbi:MAG: protein kinase [Planctomycetales bacterium]|nr:protein kinase [Planctomycetales bacterium]
MSDLPKTIGSYEILGELGRGGMGVVLHARHTALRREVALKVLPAGASPDLIARFQREARLAASLRHPHIVSVHDVGEAEGALYLAMDLIRGRSLAALLDVESPPPRRCAEMMLAVAEAVGHAHAQGILHRDVKPGNILLDEKGEPYLADFGLARSVELGESARLSRTGQAIGTPAYMSPEQAEGRFVDARTDVWACGAVLYEMLASMPPFEGDTAVLVLTQVVARDPVPLRRRNPSVPRDLESICHRCLEKDPDGRYPDAGALAEDLRRYLQGLPVRARPLTACRLLLAWLRRNRAIAATAAAGALAVAGVSSWAFAIGPAWRAAARRARLEGIEAAASAAARSEESRIAAALDATSREGAAPDRPAIEALARDARPESLAGRVREALPSDLAPGPGDAEEAAAFAAGLAAGRPAPLQARAAALLGDHPLAYRLDPTGPYGLRAAVEIARRFAEERRLEEAAAILRRVRGRHRGTPAARTAAGLLSRVLADVGDWDGAEAAALEAGDAAELPREVRDLMDAFGEEKLRLRYPGCGIASVSWVLPWKPPRKAGAPAPARDTLLFLQSPGTPAMRIGESGALESAPSPLDALPPGTSIHAAASGDLDGDGRTDLLAAVSRPGVGSGVLAIGADGSEEAPSWRLLHEDLSCAYEPIGLVAGDADGDGRIEGVVLFQHQASAQWLVRWDPSARKLAVRPWSPDAPRAWTRAGIVADLDGDGANELVLATTVHTTAEGTVYRWGPEGPPRPIASFPIGEPVGAVTFPDPERPGARLLAMGGVVTAEHRESEVVKRLGLPIDLAVSLVRFDGREAKVVARHSVGRGDPLSSNLSNLAGGVVSGRAALLFLGTRSGLDPGKVRPEGTRLHAILGDPGRTPVSVAPPWGIGGFQIVDLDGDGESELLTVSGDRVVARGRRRGPPPALTVSAGEEPATTESAALLKAGLDLIEFRAWEPARDLLAEVARRFAGSPDGIEAERLRVEAAIRAAREAREAAAAGLYKGDTEAEAREARAVAAFREAATEAGATAGRFRGDASRRRRFLLQAAEASREARDFPSAVRSLEAALAESGGADDDRVLRRDLDGLRRIADMDGAVFLRGDPAPPSMPLVADDPTRCRRLPGGALEVVVDSHHARGVVGVPVVYEGGCVRIAMDVEVPGSAWSTGLRFGLFPRDSSRDYPGRIHASLFMHGVVAWDLQSTWIGVESRLASMQPYVGGYRGRWRVDWSYLPEADLVTLEIRDRGAEGRLLCRDQKRAGPGISPGAYVLGAVTDNWFGDCFLSHGLHPVVTTVTLSDVDVRAGPGQLHVDGRAPETARDLHLMAGGALLRGDAAGAADLYRRALERDPSLVRSRLYRGLALARIGRREEAAAEARRAVRGDPYWAAVGLDDACRAAAAADVAALGALLRALLAEAPAVPTADDLLTRALALSFLGDLREAREALLAAAALAPGVSDGPAFRYLRRRGQWGPAEELNEDWDWMKSRGTVPPGTEPPTVVWAPGPGDTEPSVREEVRRARVPLSGGTRDRHGSLSLWVAASRLLLLRPEDPEGLLRRGEVGLFLGRHGLAERDWRRRADVMPDDPDAAYLVARLYAWRHATRETLHHLGDAVERGLRWDAVDLGEMEFLKDHPKLAEIRERATGR